MNGTGIIYGKQIVKNTLVKKINGSSDSDQFLVPSSDNNVNLNITSVGSTHSFALNWVGTLPIDKGGLNNTEFTGNEVLIAEPDGQAIISSGYTFNDLGTSNKDIWSADKIISFERNQQTLKVDFTIGDGILTDFTLYHNLGTRFVIVQVFSLITGDEVDVSINRLDSSNVLLSFNTPPLLDEYGVVII
jgi:hypothetical protein